MQKSKPDLTQSQLFINDTWIEDSIRVQRVFHQPKKTAKPVLEPDRPYEEACVAYGTVLCRNNLFHLWYITWSRNSPLKVCYAVSRDGISFEKPDLNLYDFEGSKKNNICLMLDAPSFIDGISVIEDFDDAAWPLKAVFYQHVPGKKELSGLAACRSNDGIRWDLTPGLVLPGYGDRTNAAAVKINGKFVVLTRIPDNPYGCRMVWRLESEDLVHWSKPEPILRPDIEDDAALEIYSSTAFKYESLYLGFAERMHMRPDKLDSELIYSQDSFTWKRVRPRNSFISWGSPGMFDNIWLSMLSNGPIVYKNNLWFYYSGRSAAHHAPYPLNYGAIGLAILRPDGFASLFNGHGEGWLATPPLEWPGKELMINADPRRELSSHPRCADCQGSIQVEVRNAENRTLSGYGRNDCLPVGNTMDCSMSRTSVLWNGNKSLRTLAGQTVRLVFYLRDAHLYSFAAGDGK